MEEIKLEKAREENAEKLADISKRAFHTDVHVGSPWGESGPPGYDSPEAQVRFMNGCDYYEIRYGDALVGAIMVLRKKTAHYECCGLFVDPEYHNRGIATRAFELIWAMYPEAKGWTVGTPAWNERTNYFYQKLGFVKTGTDGPDGIVYERRVSQDKTM
jgi:GNAT superfamily N-acetyltransferase